ncbi:APC amino acid permease [Mycena floridula]|nr:APC amino acid permease [Mycena floridula]
MEPPHAKKSMRSNDETLLATLGYKQEFKRHYSALELFGVSFSLIGVVPSVATVLVYAIPYGGPAAIVWGWATCSFFLVFIALAMAELGSAAPTSGGIYFWTYHFSSPRYRNLLSWIVGWAEDTNMIAYAAGVAGCDYGCAIEIMAAVSIGTDLAFVPTVAQTYGLFIGIIITQGILASMATKVLARMQNFFIVANVALVLVIVIGLPAATPKEFKNPASYALGGFENFTAWPKGFAFILSFLAPLSTVGGFDSSVHISEEAINASVAVPTTIISATVIGCVLGWAVNMAIVFCMGQDLGSILSSPIGQPMSVILLNSFGKRGTLVIWSLIIGTQYLIGIVILTASSRQNFALSRDGALPFSGLLYRINQRTGTPVNCVWLSVGIAALLGLLSFAGPAAIGAVFTIIVIGQYISDSIPIAARFLGGTNNFKPGPFSLGKFGAPVAFVAVSWMTFMGIVLLFPANLDPEVQSMNYAVVVVGGVLALSLGYYYLPVYGGKKWFKGPVANIERFEQEGSISDDEKAIEVDGRTNYINRHERSSAWAQPMY